MSSSARFVSGGSFNPDGPAEADAAGGSRDLVSDDAAKKKDDAWEAVTRELDEQRREREEARRKAMEGGEKSLFDILQENKAAKQAAFEEQSKFKNQFRALDEDEVEFLDEVAAKQRREEERVRKETEEGLRAFRDARRSGAVDVGVADERQDWGSLGRKRKRREREAIPGLSLRRAGDDDGGKKKAKVGEVKAAAAAAAPAKASLVAYGSDDDDGDIED